jgi:threonine aldolase
LFLVISLENTLNGTIMPIDEIRKIHNVARANGIKMHIDGARLWNASQETGVPLSEYGKYFDTVSVCLSKGVGAPIGSMLVGSKELITRARHIRKMMGGGWRQAGMLAALARHCIDTIVPTMPATHKLARDLANHLVSLGMRLVLPCETNLIFIDTHRAGISVAELADALKEKHIQIASSPGTSTRIALHYQIPPEAVEDFKQVATQVCQAKIKSGYVPPLVDSTIQATETIAYPTATN